MARLLVMAVDRFSDTDPRHRLALSDGDVIHCIEDGDEFGAKEIVSRRFRIIDAPGVTVAEVRSRLMQQETETYIDGNGVLDSRIADIRKTRVNATAMPVRKRQEYERTGTRKTTLTRTQLLATEQDRKTRTR